ncbi:MAG: hypothetical protein RL748_4021 [Pseudomonadota bacterium]|jgi:SAM-dependent methyltransferase
MAGVPEFAESNCTTPAFWDERFAHNFVPWDKGAVPLQLQQFVASQSTSGRCLIPGCGQGWEVALLADAGWQVDAIDFSAAAVARAQTQLQQIGPWASCVRQADFFTLDQVEAYDVIYERAFLCALPVAQRQAIVQQWLRLLKPAARLAGFFYLDESAAASPPKGPPFAIASQQLHDLLLPHFVCLQDDAVPDSIAVFAGKERWQVWQRL